MERHLTLRLIHTASEQVQEEIDVYLDPLAPDEFFTALSRHFIAMASRDAREAVAVRLDDMPWLHDYHLEVCEGGNPNDVVMRFREG